MLIIDCPHCGPREEAEFACGGEAHIARPLAENSISDAEFADYLFLRDNPKGMFLERWRHTAGCRRWFNVARDTVTHEIVEIYPMGALPKSKPAASAFKNSWRRQSPAEKAASSKATSAKPTSSKTASSKAVGAKGRVR